MGFTTTYDPAKIFLNFLGLHIEGYMDGTFLTVERDEDAFTLKVGADGEKARARNNNRAGKIIVTLMQGSPSNAELSALALLDEQVGTSIGPASVSDGLGTTVASCADAYIGRQAKIERGKETLGTEWTIICPELITLPGAAVVP